MSKPNRVIKHLRWTKKILKDLGSLLFHESSSSTTHGNEFKDLIKAIKMKYWNITSNMMNLNYIIIQAQKQILKIISNVSSKLWNNYY